MKKTQCRSGRRLLHPRGLMERLGAALFERRRWIHPTLLVTAILLGHPQLSGMVAGGVLLALHLAVRLWACRYIRGAARVHASKAQERKVLVTGGPFGLVRNPLYVANTIGIMGACLLFGPLWFGGVAAVASMVWYALVVRWEETILARLYGDDYRLYCELVPRFVPRLHADANLPKTDTRELYPWSKVLLRERGAVGLGLLTGALAIANAILV
jgi:protein-S-isoprenylcysteine O-methyltransferase Ste14